MSVFVQDIHFKTFMFCCILIRKQGNFLEGKEEKEMFKFRDSIDILEMLKRQGYSQYYMRQHKILSSGTMTDLKAGIVPGINVLDIICNLLHCQLSDIIEHVPDKPE